MSVRIGDVFFSSSSFTGACSSSGTVDMADREVGLDKTKDA